MIDVPNIKEALQILSTLGIGGLLGSVATSYLNKKRELQSKNQNLKENRYRSDLVCMRCFIDPKHIKHFDIDNFHISELKTDYEIQNYFKTEIREHYYLDLLYSPDFVLQKIRRFIFNSSEKNFLETATAMRKDLWGDKTKLGITDLSLED